MFVLAIDWSGSVYNPEQRIWLAEATAPGQLTRLESGRNRAEILHHLHPLRAECVAVGLDFAFSFPRWFLDQRRLASAADVWACVAELGEDWLRTCADPFWGRPGRPRPDLAGPAWRQAELQLEAVGGIRPKSIFQVGGAGSVGTGSLRGMPLLAALHAAGFRIWPFDPPADAAGPVVVEIYPRLLTGPVRKSRPEARAALLARRYPSLQRPFYDAACASEDAFDAAVSALVMIEHLHDLQTLPREDDATLRLEGRIWHPGWRISSERRIVDDDAEVAPDLGR